jgi:hypothetical protein
MLPLILCTFYAFVLVEMDLLFTLNLPHSTPAVGNHRVRRIRAPGSFSRSFSAISISHHS